MFSSMLIIKKTQVLHNIFYLVDWLANRWFNSKK